MRIVAVVVGGCTTTIELKVLRQTFVGFLADSNISWQRGEMR